MDLLESEGFIDFIILIEANYTHSGIKREYVFKDLIKSNYFTPNELKRIKYFKIDIEKEVFLNTVKFKQLHHNERIIRGKFVDCLNFNSSDIIFSLDADEVLYRNTYKILIAKVNKKNSAFQLKLVNFIYRPDYLWHNSNFIAPTVCRFDFYKSIKMKFYSRFKKYKQWRYHGKNLDFISGVHFNWHLTPKEILLKLNNYAHRDEFLHIKSTSNIQKCINKKELFWDLSLKNEISVDSSFDLLPKSYKNLENEFEHLMKNQ